MIPKFAIHFFFLWCHVSDFRSGCSWPSEGYSSHQNLSPNGTDWYEGRESCKSYGQCPFGGWFLPLSFYYLHLSTSLHQIIPFSDPHQNAARCHENHKCCSHPWTSGIPSICPYVWFCKFLFPQLLWATFYSFFLHVGCACHIFWNNFLLTFQSFFKNHSVFLCLETCAQSPLLDPSLSLPVFQNLFAAVQKCSFCWSPSSGIQLWAVPHFSWISHPISFTLYAFWPWVIYSIVLNCSCPVWFLWSPIRLFWGKNALIDLFFGIVRYFNILCDVSLTLVTASVQSGS